MTPEEQQAALAQKMQIVMTRGEIVNTVAFLRNTNFGKLDQDADTVASMYIHIRNLLEAAQVYVEPVAEPIPDNVTPITGEVLTATGEPIAAPPGTPAE